MQLLCLKFSLTTAIKSLLKHPGISVNVSTTPVEKPVIIAVLDITRNAGSLQQSVAQISVNAFIIISCNCHGHAIDCYYDPEIEQRKESLNIYGEYQGGGVCIDCQHNTAGVNCERCAKGYYRPYGVPVTAPDGCTRMLFSSYVLNDEIIVFSAQSGLLKKAVVIMLFHAGCNCIPEHSDGCEEGSGRCYCKRKYQGKSCNKCADGYHNFPFCY
ncbi:hypothetical protein JD844_016353 [Phrynosoma platyrhinos]|uniref:Laminin EGF-like domain-containing protein n=1 Tax=Phrynosoma platyrhinos TaxID=52577 RepID=A0ABQ7SKA2_PHRPL|nr:hypothetical protein JD844_016353 [Phrynosoma platyrhinos]